MTGPMRREYEANPENAVKAWIEDRLSHHAQATEYFANRREDLLIIDICDTVDSVKPAQAIARFLRIDVSPSLAMPRENQNPAKGEAGAIVRPKAVVREEVRAAFRSLDLPEGLAKSVFP